MICKFASIAILLNYHLTLVRTSETVWNNYGDLVSDVNGNPHVRVLQDVGCRS